ncbi:alpha/beta hydrolase [Pseudodesulfovibrio sp. JC047]|nr:alpha/beta hydrolase [Pseudodesulfovibrio sp. JC047]
MAVCLRGHGPVLRVYIEGDGKAWLSKRRPSVDPTPENPVAFHLASIDPFSVVGYLARPCQFVCDDSRRNCRVPVWTSARFSEPVVADMDVVLETLKSRAKASRLELVGYSGGGAIALLLAARRTDVDSVITIAGNLDHAFWTTLHHVSPLRNSLNPADFSYRLEAIPQIHIVSTDDTVMPPTVAAKYVGRFEDPQHVKIMTVDGISHGGDWGAVVSEVLTTVERSQ